MYSRVCHLFVGSSFKWFVSETPYFEQQATKTPNITSSCILSIVQSLNSKKNVYINKIDAIIRYVLLLIFAI